MKIAILTQYFYPETGAPQNRLLELSQMLKESGWEVKVITAMPNYPKGRIFDEYKGKLRSKENISGIDVERFWLYASNAPKTVPRVISMATISATSLLSMSSLRGFSPDYIFAESPPLLLALTGLVLSKMSGAKFIMNVSDIWPLSAKELGSISDGALYRKIESLEKFLYRKAFMCTGQSQEIVDHLKKSGAVRTYLFRNGVDVKRFSAQTKEKTGSGNLRIIYAGLLGVAQRVSDIVKHIDFASLGAELHIYGEGAEKRKIEKYVLQNPGKGVFMHESVQRENIPSLLSEFDCALIPLVTNIYGAVPSKIYEAMAAGLPILFSGAGEGASIVKKYDAGLVNAPSDFRMLEENIRMLQSDTALQERMSVNCRRAASENFDRNKIIPEFAKVLEANISN